MLNVSVSLPKVIWDLIVSVPDHCLSFYFPVFVYQRVR